VTKTKKIQTLLGVALLNGVLFGVGLDLLSDYAKQHFHFALAISGVIAVSYLLFTWMVNRFEKRSRMELTLSQRENPQSRKGLIVLMSPGDRTTPAENAVKAHLSTLEHCWVICGPDRPNQRPTSRENAAAIKERYGAARQPPVSFYLREVRDEDNPQQTYHLVRSIYEEAKAFGLAENDIIADYTGGTKSMTAGMVLACSTSEDRDTEYMKAKQVTAMGTAIPTAQAVPVLIDLNFGSSQ
jgi:hypothetical protein